MTNARHHIRGLKDSFFKRPLCVATGLFMFGLMTSLGIVITGIKANLTMGQSDLYAGPEKFLPLTVWGWLFVAAGLSSIIRVFLLDFRRVQMSLHGIAVFTTVLWAIAFFFGPLSTGQVLYGFLAVSVIAQPFIPQIVVKAVRLAGMDITTGKDGDASLMDYDELRGKMDRMVMDHFGNNDRVA